MTGTVIDALQDATAALNNATAQVLAQYEANQAAALAAQTKASGIINNFLAAPPAQTVWVDPLNGDDSKSGATAALAKRSIDTVLDSMGVTGTTILLLNDAVMQRRRNIYAGVAIYGVQPSAAAPGYTPMQRKLGFLGTATNSPDPSIGSFCAGMWLFNASALHTNSITFDLPAQPAGQTYAAHLHSDYGVNLNLYATVLVDDPSAGALIGAFTNTLDVYAQLINGPGVAGHLFLGVAAGGNPNSLFQYRSNLGAA